MSFEVIPEPNEEVILIREFRMKNADPFAIAVSTLAIYLPQKRFLQHAIHGIFEKFLYQP